MTTRRILWIRAAVLCIPLVGLLAAVRPAFAWHRWREHYTHSYRARTESDTKVFSLSRALPNATLTPGALNSAVTPATIRETICVRGYTRTIRPPEEYTERLKRRQIREYGYSDYRLGAYEEDHLLSLELGGSPTSPKNLWPEPHKVQGGWGSYTKDQLENRLNHMVCRGQLPLRQAQAMIVHDWIAAYKELISPTPIADRADRY